MRALNVRRVAVAGVPLAAVAAISLGLPLGHAAVPSAEMGSLSEAQFRVGPAEVVFGPSRYPDSSFTVARVGSTYRGYSANQTTIRLDGPSLEDLAVKGGPVMEKAEEPAFDSCGAWLEGVSVDPESASHLRGWYHAETECDYDATPKETHKSVAYVESTDGGKTFSIKPANNQVITSGEPTPGQITGRGDPTIIERDGYFYAYFRDHKPTPTGTVEQAAVARAPISSGGVPGSWTLYTPTGWDGNALGGSVKPLDTAPGVKWSASLARAFGAVMTIRQVPSSEGFLLSSSVDGTTFTSLPVPLLPIPKSDGVVDVREKKDEISRQQFLYPSVLGADGSRTWDDRFYLFHTYVMPGDGGNEKYLVRRKVSVETGTPNVPGARVALARYRSASTGDEWSTAGVVPATHAYAGVLGYLPTQSGAGKSVLSDCLSATGDHYASTSGCADASERQRNIGFVWNYGSTGRVQLVMCKTGTGNKFLATSQACDGRGSWLWNMGYIYPAVGDEKAPTTRRDQASRQFSGLNDATRWTYRYELDGGGSGLMTYDAGNDWWDGPGGQSFLRIRSDSMHPGPASSAIRRWTADTDATIRIWSTIRDGNTGCGDDAEADAKVLHRSGGQVTQVWAATIPRDDPDGISISPTVTVRKGDTIDFVISRGTGGNLCDLTLWNPSIDVTP